MRSRIIAPAGWKYIASAFLLALIFSNYLNLWAGLPFFIAGSWLLFSFRDPPREIPSEPLGVLSPIDGIITNVELGIDDPCCSQRKANKVSMRISRISAYPLRSPIEGKVETSDADSEDKRQASWVIRTDEDDLIAVRVKWRHSVIRGGRTYVRFGQRIGQGRRCGSVPLRSKVDVFVPENAEVYVEAGERVRAGEHVLAMLHEH